MASQTSYSRSGNRPYHPSLASINGADQFGNTREMGPPSDFPLPTLEIDLHTSRTLPSPSTFVSTAWDSSGSFQPNAFRDYAPPATARSQQIPVESPPRAQHDPLHLWYSANDGPWVPRHALPEDLSQSKHTGNRISMSYGGQYRQPNPSEAGSYQVGIAPSDSGYGTRKSVGNTSVFSGEFPERDQDCQSLASHIQDFQPFQQPFGSSLQPHDVRTAGSWTSPSVSIPSDALGLICVTCRKSVRTQSDLKKHNLRHTKPFVCEVDGCSRNEGFSTRNDLERHIKSKHPTAFSETAPTKKYRCQVPGCKSKEKSWPRLDNFRSHLKRVHSNFLQTDEQFEDMIRSGEHWDRTSSSVDSGVLPQLQRPPEIAQSRSLANDNLPLTRFVDPWTQEESTFLSSAERGQFITPPTRDGTSAQRSALPEEQQQTVQPMDTYRVGRALESSVRLDRVQSAPVSRDESTRNSDDGDHQPPRRANTDDAARQTSKKNSALEATVTEVLEILTAADPDRVMHNTTARNPLPDGKVSPNSWSMATDTTLPVIDKRTENISGTDRSSGTKDPKDPLVSEKALEVFKALASKLGYTLHKEPTNPPTPKIQNAGSVASNKSDHKITCPTCKKFRGRPCELRKHMKRHERPYGCTFQTCKKSFGSKNDWKRHENSQHFHLEAWRCDLGRLEGGDTPCAKVCYRRQIFKEHLKKDHQITSEKTIEEKLYNCRIGRNCQARFWCGFCKHLVDLKKKGLHAWAERFDHIDDHFMGRNESDDGKKWNINDWVPVDGKPSEDGEPSSISVSMSASPEKHHSPPSASPSASPSENSSPETTAKSTPGESPAHAIDLEAPPPSSQKRKASGSGDDRPHKQAKSSLRMEISVICCQCHLDHNPRVNPACINSDCPEPHEFASCTNCRAEYREAPEEN